ncbi:MAG: hypothetical protein WA137_07860 [Methanothrix sp.]
MVGPTWQEAGSLCKDGPGHSPLANCSVTLLRNHVDYVTLQDRRVWPSGKSPGPRGDPRSAARQPPSRSGK